MKGFYVVGLLRSSPTTSGTVVKNEETQDFASLRVG